MKTLLSTRLALAGAVALFTHTTFAQTLQTVEGFQIGAVPNAPGWLSTANAVSGNLLGNHWRLVDSGGNVVFDTCIACGVGRLTLTRGGTYTLMVSSDQDPSTGTHGFQIANFP